MFTKPKKESTAEIDAKMTASIAKLQDLINEEKRTGDAFHSALADQERLRRDPKAIAEGRSIDEATIQKLAFAAAKASSAVEAYQETHGTILAMTHHLQDVHCEEQAELAHARVEKVVNLCRQLLAASKKVADLDAEIKAEVRAAYSIYPVDLKDRSGAVIVPEGAGLPRDLGYSPGSFDTTSGAPGGCLYAGMRLVMARWRRELLDEGDPVIPLLEQVVKLGFSTGMVLYVSR